MILEPWCAGDVELAPTESFPLDKPPNWSSRPLPSFTDLTDVNRQARQWLAEAANRRVHRETRQTLRERFQPEALRSQPALDPD
jgi:hypothetical protein